MSAPAYPTTPAQAARATRRPDLARAVAAHGRCTTPDVDAGDEDFFRADGENAGEWALRRRDLLAHCAGCPVQAACAELALRYDGRGDLDAKNDLDAYDDHIRGGLTAAQLARIRRQQGPAIQAAVDADRATDHDRATVHAAYRTLRQELATDLTCRRSAADQQRKEAKARAAAANLAAARARRRTANGWSTAA